MFYLSHTPFVVRIFFLLFFFFFSFNQSSFGLFSCFNHKIYTHVCVKHLWNGGKVVCFVFKQERLFIYFCGMI